MHIILQCHSFTIFAEEKKEDTSKKTSKKTIDLNRKYDALGARHLCRTSTIAPRRGRIKTESRKI